VHTSLCTHAQSKVFHAYICDLSLLSLRTACFSRCESVTLRHPGSLSLYLQPRQNLLQRALLAINSTQAQRRHQDTLPHADSSCSRPHHFPPSHLHPYRAALIPDTTTSSCSHCLSLPSPPPTPAAPISAASQRSDPGIPARRRLHHQQHNNNIDAP
jgi:hypothetical protein